MSYIIIFDCQPPYTVGPFPSIDAAHAYIKTDPEPAHTWQAVELNAPAYDAASICPQAAEPTDTKPVRKVCAHCGSTNVHLDVWGNWNENAQQWEPGVTFDHQHCDSCGSETTINDEVIES